MVKRARYTADETVRPIRLWLPATGEGMRHYYYTDARHAQERALILIAWQAVTEPIEVYNCVTGRLLAVYKQTTNGEIHYERF